MRILVAAIAVLTIAGCATTPITGGRAWHEQRILEIETAYENGALNEEAYLSLKNKTDQTRVDYQERVQANLRYDSFDSFRYYHYNSMHRHHHRPQRPHRP